MDIAIGHPSFVTRSLSLRPAGMLRGAKLLQSGSQLRGKRMTFEVRDDADRSRVVRIKGRFLDPLPVIEIDGEPIHLGRSLTWYEYAWMGIPVVLVTIGGALGGALGFAAAYGNARIFRGDRSAPAKYALTGLVSLGTAVAFLVLATVIQLALA
jgi:hypothetical protein